ncbi:hypothetical protein [Mycoplasmopsis synoviae]|uniref:hypothetical protein n=1 Tax=Mycoplasmopsis synoviae TaxID=2109 RepID=UPI00356477A2
MKKYKLKVTLWLLTAIFSLIMIIVLSSMIVTIENTLALARQVELDTTITNSYGFIKAYAIGAIAFFLIITLMGTAISYAGFKSWKYAEMFG